MSTPDFDPEYETDCDTEEVIRDHFGHDESDGQYGLTVWFDPEAYEMIVHFCTIFGICPVELAEFGLRAVIEATIDPETIVTPFPTSN